MSTYAAAAFRHISRFFKTDVKPPPVGSDNRDCAFFTALVRGKLLSGPREVGVGIPTHGRGNFPAWPCGAEILCPSYEPRLPM